MAMGRRVYLDNAATSFPKPPGVATAMTHFTRALGASPGRGAYDEAVQAGRALQTTRVALAALLHETDPTRLVFTLNCTDALSLAIYGTARHWLRRGEGVHLVTTAIDHNSVLRPLNDLAADGVTHTRVAADRAKNRNPTPCTRPAIRNRQRTIIEPQRGDPGVQGHTGVATLTR